MFVGVTQKFNLISDVKTSSIDASASKKDKTKERDYGFNSYKKNSKNNIQ